MQSKFRLDRFLGFTAVLALAIAACSNDPQKQGPRETADAFLKAMQYQDYEKAKEYCSGETAKNLDLVASMARLGGSKMGDDFTITDVKEDGDYASVFYDQGKEQGKVIQLRKDEGRWVVVMSKSEMGGTKDEEKEEVDTDSGTEDGPKVSPAEQYKSYRDSKTAEEIAKAFMQALEFGDYDAAMRYGSEGTNEMLDYQKSMAALNDDKKEEAPKTILRVEEEGDFAKAYYKEKGKKDEKVLKLGKDANGNWEVIMTKAEMEDN
jgi:hypothetical protein